MQGGTPRSYVAGALFALGLIVSPALSASTITYDFDHTFAGVPPIGPTPWLTATLRDSANGVELTLAAPGLTGNEAVNQWFLNLNPALDPSRLVFAETAANNIATPAIVSAAENAFKPNWDGKYDIMFNFKASDGTSSFGADSTMTFSITGISGLKATDFLFFNTPTAGHASLYAATNIQTIGEAVIIDSDPRVLSEDPRDPVPDGGATALLLGFCGLLVETARRKLRTFCR